MSTPPKSRITVAQYLAAERQADHKSEYFQGEVFAMTGAGRRHNLISLNLAAAIHTQLKSRTCEVYAGDMRVKIDATGLYTYPDVVAVCDPPRFEDEHLDTLLNPGVIVEVLSDSTEAYDRGKKFEHYRRIESLQEYVLVSQNKLLVESYVRQSDGRWLLGVLGDGSEWLVLESIDCRVAVADIYAKVDFDDAADR